MVNNRRNERKVILVFSHKGGDTHITGAENYLLFLLKELKAQYQCILVSPIPSMMTDKVHSLGIEVVITPYSMLWGMWNPEKTLRQEQQRLLSDPSLQKLVTIIKEKKADLVITNTSVNPLPAIAAKRVGIPVGWIICEVISNNAYTKQAIHFLDQYSNWIIGISNAVLTPFNNGNLQKKTFLLHPTIDIEQHHLDRLQDNRERLRNKLRLKNSDVLLGCIAAYISPIKGFDHFLKMAIALCKKYHHVHFLLVGKPTDKAFYKNCQQIINRSEYKNKFHVLAFEENIYSVYPVIDIMVVPSIVDEGFSLVCLESLFFGKPVVAYRSGGLIEQMQKTSNEQFLVKKRNIRELERKAAQLIRNHLLRERAGQSSQIAANNYFGKGHYQQQLRLILRKVFG